MWKIDPETAARMHHCLQCFESASEKVESGPGNLERSVGNLLNAQLSLHRELVKIFGPGVFYLIEVMGWKSPVRNTLILADLVFGAPQEKEIFHRLDTDLILRFERAPTALNLVVLSQSPKADMIRFLIENLGATLQKTIPVIPSTELGKQSRL